MLGLRLGLSLGGLNASVPWYLSDDYKADDTSPTLFIDGANNRVAVSGSATTFSDLLTCTRAHPSNSAATYYDSNGYLQDATANTLRFDYDPQTLTLRGILREAASSNTLRDSDNISNATWSKTGVVAAYDAAVVNPRGTTGMYKITEDTSTGEHGIGINVNAGGIVTAMQAIYVKNLTGTRYVTLSAWNSSAGHFATATFNPITGALISSTGGAQFKDSDFEILPNGIVRIMMISVAPNTKSDFMYVRLHNGSSNSYTGDGSSAVYVWGAMRAVTEVPISHIPNNTGALTVTRAADVIVNNASNTKTFASWYNASEGTLLAAFRPRKKGATANRVGVCIDDTTANEVIKLHFADNSSDALAVDIIDGGVAQVDSDIFAFTDGGVQYIAAAYELNNCATAANESLGLIDTAATLPTPTRMVLGSSSAGEDLNGHIQAVVYWNTRISDAEVLRLASSNFFA